MVLGTLVATSAIATFGAGAFGQPAPREPVRLVYKSEGLCPAGERFFGEVRARTDKIRPAVGDERARTLRVEAFEGPTESRGSLVVVAADGTASSTRNVRAKTCQDVASALALVAALAIDPEARTTPMVDAAPPPADDATAPAPIASDAAPPPPPAIADASPPSRTIDATDASPPPPAVVTPPEAPSRTAYRGWVAFGAEGSTLLAVRPAFAVELGLDIARASVFSPLLSIRASRSFSVAAVNGPATANVTFNTIALEPCPVRATLAEGLELLPCARFAFGFVDAVATGITTPLSATRGWGDVGAHAKLVWKVAGPLRLSGHAGARFPLFKDRFFVDPDVTLYEAPPAVFAFGGDVGILFP